MTTCMEIAVHLAVAGAVFDGVDEIWDLIGSVSAVSEGFPSYSCFTDVIHADLLPCK